MLVTQAGIRIHIPAQGIKAATAAVTLVVKEALTLADIIQAGLTTQAGNQILKSGGMFYVATKEPSTIEKPLEMQVPAAYADTAMQLFKGVEADGKIDWQNPEPLQAEPTAEYLVGKQLFMTNCASCHDVAKDLTGPALANVEKRWPNHCHLFRFIRNSEGLLQSGESDYANRLHLKYNKRFHMSYPVLLDREIECLLNYINSEAQKLGIAETGPAKSDTVSAYCRYLDSLMVLRFRLMPEIDTPATAPGVIYDWADGTAASEGERLDSLSEVDRPGSGTVLSTSFEKVTPVVSPVAYHQVEIKAYGWFNIDAYLSQESGVAPCKLKVRINVGEEKLNTYLVVPRDKVFTEGGLLENGAEYGFYENNGTIPLKLGEAAFVIAIGERDGKILYGQHSFVIAQNQNIEVNVKELSDTAFKEALGALKLDNISFEVKTAKNIEEVRAVDREILRVQKMLKPGECDCFWPEINK